MLVWLLAACAERADPPNVLLVTACSLRADRVGFAGYDRPTSPRLDAFAAGAAVFDRAWANGNWTNAGHGSLLTGLWPGFHRVANDGDRVPADVPLLQEVLGAYGYRTFAVIEEPGPVSIGGDEQLLRGFGEVRTFEHAADFTPDPLAASLAATKGPWFALVHLREAHFPYGPGAPFAAVDPRVNAWIAGHQQPAGGAWQDPTPGMLAALRADPALQDNLDAVYDSGVVELDTAFGRLVDALDGAHLLDHTLVVVVADHGEELGRHGNLGHKGSLDPEVVHIPLVVRVPSSRGGGRPARLADDVSQVDVFATILDYAGAAPPARMQGRSLAPLLRGETWAPSPVLTQMVFPDMGRVVMRDLVTQGPWRLTAQGADRNDLEHEAGGTWTRVPMGPDGETLRRWLDHATADQPWTPTAPRQPTADQQRAMREKGYW